MDFVTADTLSNEALYEVAIDGFSDYVVPTAWTFEQWSGVMTQRGFAPKLSFVACEEGRPVSFWITGIAPKARPGVGYAISVGTRPSARRQGLSGQLFEHVSALLKSQGFHHMVHEVITTNAPAVKHYERLGYKKSRLVRCFRGDVAAALRIPDNVEIQVTSLDEAQAIARDISDWQPTWQNDFHALRQNGERSVAFSATHAGRIVGFGVLIPDHEQVAQIGVMPAFRRKGIASALFAHWREHYGLSKAALVNVDEADAPLIKLIGAIGLEPTVDQYELTLDL